MFKNTLKRIWTVTSRELKQFLNNPTTYIVISVFLLLWEFLFWRNFFLAGEASLRGLLQWLPWLSLVLVPALTMGSIASERSDGTLEMLLTHPAREADVVVGKFLATLILMAGLLLVIVPVGAGVSMLGNLDWGIVFSQFLAAFFMSAVFAALGVCVSSFFSSQIAALLTAAIASFFLVIIGSEFVSATLPLIISPVLEKLSILSHFDSMSRGVLDVRDLWYAITATVVFLSVAYLRLAKAKLSSQKAVYSQHRVFVSLIVAIAVVSNVVGDRIPGRIDLTASGQYTLSSATKEILGNLPDLVTINVYASSQLPAQLQPVLRDVKDILRDYSAKGHGDVVVRYKDPDKDTIIAEEAKNNGVNQIQFNVVGQSEFQVKKGFFGLSVTHAGYHQSIPYIQGTSDLEYQLTTYIHQLTLEKKPRVAFIKGHGEHIRADDLNNLTRELSKVFELTDFELTPTALTLPKDSAALIIPAPKKAFSEKEKDVIRKYIKDGGSVVFLIDAITADSKQLSSQVNANSLADLVAEYGVTVNSNLVYDLKSNQTVNVNQGQISFVVPYPFWPRVLPVKGSNLPIVSHMSAISMPWASSLSINSDLAQSKNFDVTAILGTSQAAGVKTPSGNFIAIGPDTDFPDKSLASQLMGVVLQPKASENASTPNNSGRILVLGTANLFVDDYTNRSPENLLFAVESLSWLTQGKSLASIKLKSDVDRHFFIDQAYKVPLVRYGNLAVAVLVPALWGAVRLWRRQSLKSQSYS